CEIRRRLLLETDDCRLPSRRNPVSHPGWHPGQENPVSIGHRHHTGVCKYKPRWEIGRRGALRQGGALSSELPGQLTRWELLDAVGEYCEMPLGRRGVVWPAKGILREGSRQSELRRDPQHDGEPERDQVPTEVAARPAHVQASLPGPLAGPGKTRGSAILEEDDADRRGVLPQRGELVG